MHRFLNCVYAWCLLHLSTERDEFDYMLNAPIPGAERTQPSDEVAEIEGAAFMQAMATHQQMTGG